APVCVTTRLASLQAREAATGVVNVADPVKPPGPPVHTRIAVTLDTASAGASDPETPSSRTDAMRRGYPRAYFMALSLTQPRLRSGEGIPTLDKPPRCRSSLPFRSHGEGGGLRWHDGARLGGRGVDTADPDLADPRQ